MKELQLGADLEAYRDHGHYPERHHGLFEFIRGVGTAGTFLDLGCGQGLFGQRLVDELDLQGFGVETYAIEAERAERAGLTQEIVSMHVDRGSLTRLEQMIAERSVTTMVARRSLSVILVRSVKPPVLENWAAELGPMLKRVGVTDIFLEGLRVRLHPLGCVEREVELLGPEWRCQVIDQENAGSDGGMAHLVLS